MLTNSSFSLYGLPLHRSPQFCSPQLFLPLLHHIPAAYHCSAHRNSAHDSSVSLLTTDFSYPCYHSSAYHFFLVSLLFTTVLLTSLPMIHPIIPVIHPITAAYHCFAHFNSAHHSFYYHCLPLIHSIPVIPRLFLPLLHPLPAAYHRSAHRTHSCL